MRTKSIQRGKIVYGQARHFFWNHPDGVLDITPNTYLRMNQRSWKEGKFTSYLIQFELMRFNMHKQVYERSCATMSPLHLRDNRVLAMNAALGLIADSGTVPLAQKQLTR